MGSVTVSQKNKKASSAGEGPAKKIVLDVDVNRGIPPNLLQLTNWSLAEIRDSIQTFQRQSQSPMVDSFLFHKMTGFNKKNSDIVFSSLSRGEKYVSIYEIICILVLTSYQTYKKKFQFLMMVFDFQHRGHLAGKEFLLIFESMLYGFFRLTGQPPESFSKLEKFAIASFFPGDQEYGTKQIDILKFIVEYEANPAIYSTFNRFEHSELKEIKEDFSIFSISSFKKYSPEEVAQIYRIIQKAYQKSDYEQVQMIEQNKEMRRQNRRDSCYRKLIEDKLIMADPSLLRSYHSKQTLKPTRSVSLAKFNSAPRYDSPITERRSSFRVKKVEGSGGKAEGSGGKGEASRQKLIFLRGQTYSKKDVFETINYFKTISDSEEKVSIKDFFKKFEKKTFMKKQLSSIFKLLDYHHKSEISLEGFFKAIYPGIDQADLKLLFSWYSSYQQIYEADKLARNLVKPVVMSDSRLLPAETLDRLRQIFAAMDIGDKGYLNFDDLRKAYKHGFTADQLEELVREYGEEKKIKLGGLCKMLLPQGWEIEGVNIEQL